MGGFSKKGTSGDVDRLISKGGRVEGWKGGFSKKGPSGDVDDVRRPFYFSIYQGGRVEGWIFKKGPKRR